MLKPSDIGRFLLGLLAVAIIAAIVLWRVGASHRPPTAKAPAPPPPAAAPVAANCNPKGWQAAAAANRVTLNALQWSPFGPNETGWATYAPLIAREIGAHCPPDSPGFAERYAHWQASRKLPPDGVFKAREFDALRDALALERPFVQLTSRSICPASPPEASLAQATAAEGYGGKAVRLRPAALEAYRKMLAAARAQGVGVKPPLMKLVSGYRGPAEEAARCADGGCNTLTRAHCSAHRTGLAIDLYLDPAPGHDPISSDEANRRHMAQTPEYRWLTANARAFGFLPYAYEPWHWEYTGEAP
jgi:hypothetical protein